MPDRTTIVLPPLLKQRAISRARVLGISFAEFVRQAVEKQLASPTDKVTKVPWKRGSRKTGDPFWDNLRTFDDGGPTDLSVRHDDYIYGEEP
jgi:hypothetical protein